MTIPTATFRLVTKQRVHVVLHNGLRRPHPLANRFCLGRIQGRPPGPAREQAAGFFGPIPASPQPAL